MNEELELKDDASILDADYDDEETDWRLDDNLTVVGRIFLTGKALNTLSMTLKRRKQRGSRSRKTLKQQWFWEETEH